MTEPPGLVPVWKDLPDVEKVKAWDEIAPGSAIRILNDLETGARDFRRQEWARMACAMGAFVLTSAFTFFLAMGDHLTPAMASSGVGTITIVGLFLRVKPPLRRKRRR